MASTATTKHPLGALLAQYRARKPGLTQTRLAELAGYDQAIVTRMAQGKKDLTGPSGRERIVRIIETLADQNAIHTLDEANALLLAADLPPLFERQPAEAKLIARFSKTPAGLRTRRTNLPALVSSFIGRTREIAEVRQLLGASRLVTLTGAGGAGKTRLAQRVAADVLLLYPDGVWYAELAALRDPTKVADAGLRAFSLVPSDQPALEQLTEHLRERHALLVLDNCEHLIDAIAEFAIVVLQTCPRVSILATSREAMNVEGERAWRVPPMQPDEASRLFVERVVSSRNALETEDAQVAHICKRLDGMPLAIELAAARLQVMSLSEIATRLDDRFTLLAHGRRGALPRHQTLRAMIDWSYTLLSEREKIAFRQLSVFVGGWELDLAESLIGADALVMLTQLVSKSLVVVDEAGDSARYRLLETIREYALERLHDAGELDAAQRRHAEAVAALVERAEQPMRGREQKFWLDRINRDRANLEAALAWCFGPAGDALIGCRIASMLKMVWISTPATLNAERWVNTALAAMTDDMPARVRAALHNVHATVNLGEMFHNIVAEYEVALRLYEKAGDLAGMADAIYNIAAFRLEADLNDAEAWQMLRSSIDQAEAAGNMLVANCARMTFAASNSMAQRFDEAESIMRESIPLCKAQHDWINLSKMYCVLAHTLLEQLKFDEALQYYEQATYFAQITQNPIDEMVARGVAAEALRYMGELTRSIELLEEVLLFAKAHLSAMDQTMPMLLLAKALNDAGEHARAKGLLIDLIQLYQRKNVRNPDWYTFIFDIMACIHSAEGDALKSARLSGAADTCLYAVQHRRMGHHIWEYAPYLDKARCALGYAAFEAARREGQAMALDQAIDYALKQR